MTLAADLNTVKLRRTQVAASLGLLAVVASVYAGVSLLSRNATVLAYLENKEQSQWKVSDGLYAYRTGFVDHENRLFLKDLPEADYSRGGVYFVGSSTTLHSIMPWELPAPDRPFVHNYAVQSMNYREQAQWVKFLVEQERVLRAGSGKNLFVLGLSHLDSRMKIKGTTDWDFVPQLFERHGLYAYGAEAGITPVEMNVLARRWKTEQMRASDFLSELSEDLTTPAPKPRAPVTDPKAIATDRRKALSFMENMMDHDHWSAGMDQQVHALAAMIELLQSHGAEVAGVELPYETWNDDQPYAARFHAEVTALAASRHFKLVDLRRAVPDDEFADKTHLGYKGQVRIQPVLAGVVEDFLRRARLVSDAPAAR